MMDLVARSLDRTAYRAQQWSIRFPLALMRRLAATLATEKPDPGARAMLEQRYQALLERDLENVELGLYPRSLLFQIPFGTYAWALPRLLLDTPRLLRRIMSADHRDLPDDVELEQYPSYFRRTYHWQTDGYLSLRSAELYDVGVELLFVGTADVMRRQVIPPISRFLGAPGVRNGGTPRASAARATRLLDIGCGTGRTLVQLAMAHPSLRLCGLDLSPFYLQAARRVLASVPDVSLMAENAEHMPFRDEHFTIATSVYLFHELPRAARRNVLTEAYRVLRPGGLLVVEDSAQLAESGDLAFFLERFATDFHEPFYRDYIGDDLALALGDAGFLVETVEPHFVSKVVVARKPGPTAPRA